jgi:hypothetical protein
VHTLLLLFPAVARFKGCGSLFLIGSSVSYYNLRLKFRIKLLEKFSLLIDPGDCGSWVIDSTNGVWYGQIVAAKPETAVAYIILARDIFRDIQDQFGGQHVRMPIESDFVSEAVSGVKREHSRSSSTAQSSSQQDFTRSCISRKNKKRVTFQPEAANPHFGGYHLCGESPEAPSWTKTILPRSQSCSVRHSFTSGEPIKLLTQLNDGVSAYLSTRIFPANYLPDSR